MKVGRRGNSCAGAGVRWLPALLLLACGPGFCDPPDFNSLTQPVSVTAPDIALGKLVRLLAEQTGLTLYVDARYSSVRVCVLGGEGRVGELMQALEGATGLRWRRVGEAHVLASTLEGVAALAHDRRRTYAASWERSRRRLSSLASAALWQVFNRLPLLDPRSQLSWLGAEQLDILAARGYLTLGELFPEPSHPVYELMRGMGEAAPGTEGTERLAQQKLYFSPSLSLVLRISGAGGRVHTLPVELGEWGGPLGP